MKPSNVIFVGGVAKLADIGLVAGVDDARSFVGTEGYIPPEGPGTPSADCYSLGKLLYELSTGHDRNAWPEPPADLATRPDRERLLELNAILHRACAPDPRQRYANAAVMLADLDRLGGGKSVRRAHQAERRWRVARRGAGWLVVAGLALTLIALVSRVWQPPAKTQIEKRSTNGVANDFYDLGRYACEKNNKKDIRTSTTNFERAIEADPKFAGAHAALALTYVWSDNGSNHYFTLLPAAKDSAQRALALDNPFRCSYRSWMA